MFESISPKKENSFRQNEAERTEEGLDRRKFVLMSILASAGIILSKNKIYSILKGFIENGGDAETQPDVPENKTTRNEETDQKKEYIESEEVSEESETEENDVIGHTFREQILAYIATEKEISLGPDTQKSIYQNWLEKYAVGSVNYEKGIVGGLERMEPWAAEIKKTFQKYGVPEDFIYLAISESHFKINAASKAKYKYASKSRSKIKRVIGPYQIDRSTAEKMHLRVDDDIDERLDPIKSAELCAKHLSESYERFGGSEDDRSNRDAWVMALLDYNGGYVNDFNSFLNSQKLHIREKRPLGEGGSFAKLARHFNTSLALLYRANADTKKTSFGEWMKDSKGISPKTIISIPQEIDLSLENFNRYLEKRVNDDIKKDLAKDSYTVRSGDTLSAIADRLDMKVDELLSLNLGHAGKYLRAGQELRVPKKKKKNIKYLQFILSDFKENINYPGKFFAILKIIKDNHLEEIIEGSRVTFLTKKIKQKGSLLEISRREKIDLYELIRLNPAIKNTHKTILPPGMKIRVPNPYLAAEKNTASKHRG